jgi:hypothetical protein
MHSIRVDAQSQGAEEVGGTGCRNWRTSGEPSHIVRATCHCTEAAALHEAAPSANSRERGACASFNEDYGAASRPINP